MTKSGDYTQNPFNECNRDFSPVETIAGALDYLRLADYPGFKSPQGRLMQCLSIALG